MTATWQIGRQEAILVGELHCPRCKRVTDVTVGGMSVSKDGAKPKRFCPACKGWTGNYWVNEIRDAGTLGCLFGVDERPE